MPNENHEILVQLARMEQQINRLVSDAESEKEVRRDRNKEIDRRLLDLEIWRSNLQGRIVITVAVGSGAWSLIIALILWVIKK